MRGYKDAMAGTTWRSAAVLLMGVLMLAACGSGQGTATPSAGAAPKPESELIFMGPGLAIGDVYKKTLNTWGAQNGVRITYIEGNSSAGWTRVQAGLNQTTAQVDMLNGNDAILTLGKGQNAWAKLDPKLVTNLKDTDPNIATPKDVVGSPPVGFRVSVQPVGIAYNPTYFQRNGWDPPTSWLDLYDSKYAKCVIPVGPTDGTQGWIPMLNYLNSGDYSKIDTTLANFKKIAKNIPAFVTTNPEALDLITRGIGCMAPAFQSRSLSSIAAGAPVKFIFPKEGGLYIGGDTYITRNAPHPIAAQMAANALLSLESQQEALEKAGNSGVHLKLKKPSTGTAASVTLASDFKSVPGGMRFIPLSAYNNLDDWVRKWNEMASTR